MLALPGLAIEAETGFIRRPVISAIITTPAKLFGVMLRAAESPHVVQRPNDRLLNVADVGDQILKALLAIYEKRPRPSFKAL
jgi:hypothetical protein